MKISSESIDNNFDEMTTVRSISAWGGDRGIEGTCPPPPPPIAGNPKIPRKTPHTIIIDFVCWDGWVGEQIPPPPPPPFFDPRYATGRHECRI